MWGAKPPTDLKAIQAPRGRADLKNAPPNNLARLLSGTQTVIRVYMGPGCTWHMGTDRSRVYPVARVSLGASCTMGAQAGYLKAVWPGPRLCSLRQSGRFFSGPFLMSGRPPGAREGPQKGGGRSTPPF